MKNTYLCLTQTARGLVLATAFSLGAGTASISNALTLDFSFEFTNTGEDGSLVTGLITGLPVTGTAAASFLTVTFNTGLYGIGTYPPPPNQSINEFTVSNGEIISAEFESYGSFNSAPDVTCCSLLFETFPTFVGAVLTPNPLASPSRLGVVTFTRLTPLPPVEPPVEPPVGPPVVPLPASALLLLGALAGLVGARKMRRKS